MSVQPTLIHVMCMLLVTIPLGLITAPVILGSMEVDKSALVKSIVNTFLCFIV